MNQKFRFTAEPRSALCLLSMALMLLSAAARLWYYLADPVATAMTLLSLLDAPERAGRA